MWKKGNVPNFGTSKKKKKTSFRCTAAQFAALSLLLLCVGVFYGGGISVHAAGEEVVQSAFDVIYSLIAAIISAIGTLLLLWGVFEWAQSLNVQDGGAQSMAFKRIASGLIATLVPQILPLILSQIKTA